VPISKEEIEAWIVEFGRKDEAALSSNSEFVTSCVSQRAPFDLSTVRNTQYSAVGHVRVHSIS
jgi:hypothetical protein